MTTPQTPTNGGALGGTSYSDAFTYVDPSATTDPDGTNDVASGTCYTVPPTTNFAGCNHYGQDSYGPIDVTSTPVITHIFPLKPGPGQYGTMEGSGFFGHVPQLAFVPKAATSSGYGTPIPVPCSINDDNSLTFGPLPANFQTGSLKGGKWVYSNHRGASQKPVCDPSTVTGYSPTHGSPGDRIHILGTFGAPVDDVVFGGGVHADKSTIINDPNGYYVSVVVPSGAISGPVCIYCDQTCSGADACADPSNPFTVDGTCPAPYISGFQPTGGVAGTHVTVYGQAFTGATAVKIKGQDMASFTVQNDGTITCVIPNGAQSGHITVDTPCGHASSPTWFNIGGGGSGPPVIDSLTPNPCPQAVVLTIYGQGFSDLSPQGGVKYVSGNSTYFLNGHWTVQNGGTQITVDAAGTFSLPPNTQGNIVVTNVAGDYDQHPVTITPFNPKLAVSAKAPYFQSGPNLIIAPGAVISTSPPADVVDAPGLLGLIAVAGLSAAEALSDSTRSDSYTNPPGSFTIPAKTTAGTAITHPHPYTHTNKGSVTAHWTQFGKVVSLEEYRADRAKMMARSAQKEYDAYNGCVEFFILGPKWNEGKNEVVVNCLVTVTDARCMLSVTQITGQLMLGGTIMQHFDTGPVIGFGGNRTACEISVYADAWQEAVQGAFGNVWQCVATAEVDYFNPSGISQSASFTRTVGGLNCGDANSTVLSGGNTATGCPN